MRQLDPGYGSAGHGGMLFCNHDSDHCDESWKLPGVFARIFEETFGFRQAAAGGFGAVLMNGIKRGLFSNEAGSDLLRVRQQQRNVTSRSKAGLVQALGVFCGYDRDLQLQHFIVLLAPEEKLRTFRNGSSADSNGTSSWPFWCDLYCGDAVLFSFSTFLGILFMRDAMLHIFSEITGLHRLHTKYWRL